MPTVTNSGYRQPSAIKVCNRNWFFTQFGRFHSKNNILNIYIRVTILVTKIHKCVFQ